MALFFLYFKKIAILFQPSQCVRFKKIARFNNVSF